MGFLDMLWDSAASKAVKILSHSLGPVALDFEPTEKKAVYKLPLPDSDMVMPKPQYKFVPKPPYKSDIVMPKPLYSHLSEEEKMKIFGNWMTKYGKSYKNGREKAQKFINFKNNMESVERICRNRKEDCCFGLNGFRDMNLHEFAKYVGRTNQF